MEESKRLKSIAILLAAARRKNLHISQDVVNWIESAHLLASQSDLFIESNMGNFAKDIERAKASLGATYTTKKK